MRKKESADFTNSVLYFIYIGLQQKTVYRNLSKMKCVFNEELMAKFFLNGFPAKILIFTFTTELMQPNLIYYY